MYLNKRSSQIYIVYIFKKTSPSRADILAKLDRAELRLLQNITEQKLYFFKLHFNPNFKCHLDM